MMKLLSSDAAAMVKELTSDLEDALLERVWSQWMLLGATAAGRRPSRPTTQIDPEALLLASLALREREPRLDDVLLGWLRSNAALVSVQRVRNLAPHYANLRDVAGQQQLGWLAHLALTEGKDARWRALAASAPVLAMQSGLESSRARSKSPPPALQPTEPHHLLLRLRLGLGVGIKADVVAFLLGQYDNWHTIRSISDALTYTLAPMRRALEDLANAAFIDRRVGHPVRYRVTPSRWEELLSLPDSGFDWGGWDERFRFAADWLAWAHTPRQVELTDYVCSVEARNLLARHTDFFGQTEMELTGQQPATVLARITNQVSAFAATLRPHA
jgi:hypothetical protein